jgi:hypothetical protein
MGTSSASRELLWFASWSVFSSDSVREACRDRDYEEHNAGTRRHTRRRRKVRKVSELSPTNVRARDAWVEKLLPETSANSTVKRAQEAQEQEQEQRRRRR